MVDKVLTFKSKSCLNLVQNIGNRLTTFIDDNTESKVAEREEQERLFKAFQEAEAARLKEIEDKKAAALEEAKKKAEEAEELKKAAEAALPLQNLFSGKVA
jgi:hypothetical protein